ncbi:hypothetical protein [Salibacterium aidingense]|uniref:hypothetical protein n=1 Tax=Salibacterium aidingense TaxID=384933 RepID=UPI000407935B|nr:hypothetical protein [Salibacterium aidingense]
MALAFLFHSEDERWFVLDGEAYTTSDIENVMTSGTMEVNKGTARHFLYRELVLKEAGAVDQQEVEDKVEQAKDLHQKMMKHNDELKTHMEEAAEQEGMAAAEYMNTIWEEETRKNVITSQYIAEHVTHDVELVPNDNSKEEEHYNQVLQDHQNAMFEKYDSQIQDVKGITK